MSQKSQQTEKEIKVKPATKIIIILTNILSITIPLVAFTIIPLVVDNFHLFYYEKDEKVLNTHILIYLLIAIIVSIFFIWLNCFLSTKDYNILTKKAYDEMLLELNTLQADNIIYSDILDIFNHLCDHKFQTLRTVLNKTSNGKENHVGQIISDPQNQIINMLNEYMCAFLKRFTESTENTRYSNYHIAVSAAFKTKNSDWQWFQNCEPESGVRAKNLASDPQTAFFHLLSAKDRFILYNSKKAEASLKQYIFTNTSGNDGSLVGRRIAVGDAADPFIEIVIFFSTTGDILFVPDNNERQIKELKNKLKGWFFNAFDKRIKIELALFFLNNYSF